MQSERLAFLREHAPWAGLVEGFLMIRKLPLAPSECNLVGSSEPSRGHGTRRPSAKDTGGPGVPPVAPGAATRVLRVPRSAAITKTATTVGFAV